MSSVGDSAQVLIGHTCSSAELPPRCKGVARTESGPSQPIGEGRMNSALQQMNSANSANESSMEDDVIGDIPEIRQGRTGSTASKKSYGDSTGEQFAVVYHRTTWQNFAVLFTFLLVLESIYLGVCYSFIDSSVLTPIDRAGRGLKAAGNQVGMLVATGAAFSPMGAPTPEFLKALGELGVANETWQTVVPLSYSNGQKVWIVQSVGTTFSMIICLVVGALAYIHRELPIVKSRGKFYMIHAFGSGILLLCNVYYMSAAFTLQLTDYPTIPTMENAGYIDDQTTHLMNNIFASTVFAWVFACYFLGALVQRQRVIMKIFNKRIKVGAKIDYMKPFPLHLVFGALCCTTFAFWRFYYKLENGHGWVVISGYVCPIVYSTWFGYYIYKTRDAHARFSDFYSNIRILISFVVTLFFAVTFSTIYTTSLWCNPIGWNISSRLSATGYALDQLQCLYVQHKYAHLMPKNYSSTVSRHQRIKAESVSTAPKKKSVSECS